LISGGGTGGHVYPALAIVEALTTNHGPQTIDELLYVGSEGGVEEELVKRAGLPFAAIPAGGLHGLAPLTAARNLVKLARGLGRSLSLISNWKPDVLLVTGGFVSVPVALACWLRRVPILVYLPDIEPARSVKLLGQFATRIAATAEASKRYLPARKIVVTGYPLRAELLQVRDRRAEAREHFGLDATRKTVLIFGGSKGARSLNRAVGQLLDALLAGWQVIHISGALDEGATQARREQLNDEQKSRYKLFAYLHSDEMGLALAAADVAVSRAGASVLGEFPLMGLPAILVPYPYAWRYQKVNADYLGEQGAAVRLDDERLGEELLPTLTGLLNDDARLADMQRCASNLARPQAAAAIANQLRELGERRA
jgi:undecaprenyldiphospho-muramoylpentapeptide beta-N-acetylglucosaminyltransferase